MKIDTSGGSKLDFFQELYEEARSASAEIYEKMRTYKEQYKGSTEIDGSDTPAKQIRNITYELVESQVTSYVPSPSVTSKIWSEDAERNAKSIEKLLLAKRNELPFEKMNDLDERFSPIYGGSVWLVEWDESIVSRRSLGDIKVSCLAPHRFTGQPNIFDVDDMEYCFIEFETTKEEIVRKYGVTLAEAEEATEGEIDGVADDKTATIIVCYYRDDEDRICQYVWAADTELLDIEDFYARKRKVCRKCGKREQLCECESPKFEEENEEYEEVETDILLSNGEKVGPESPKMENGIEVRRTRQMQAVDKSGTPAYSAKSGVYLPLVANEPVAVMEKTRLPFYKPKKMPIVIRKNTSEEDSLFGQSDCEFIRPQQQGVNKLESRIMEKLMGGGVYPIVPENANVELDGTIFKKVFRAKQSDANLYGKIDLEADVSRDSAAAERLYDHAKRTLGISDSFMGQRDSTALSGKAKELQIQQAAGRLDSKRKMKNAAYAEIDRVIFELYLAYADEPRTTAFKDAQGRWQNATFNRYDFLKRDGDGEYYYDDEYLFSADATVDAEHSREFLWQENRANYTSGAYGNPADPQTQLIFWQNMERAHYPYARDNVERITEQIARMQREAQLTAIAQAEADAHKKDVAMHEGYEKFLQNKIKQAGGTFNE